MKSDTFTTRNFSLPRSLDRRLIERATAEERPISWIVRRLVNQYLETEVDLPPRVRIDVRPRSDESIQLLEQGS